MHFSRRFTGILAALAIVVLAWPAMALDYVVVKAAGNTNYKPGDVLAETTEITIAEKQSMTLIDALGRKLLLKGPLSGDLAQLSASQNNGEAAKVELGSGRSSNIIGALSNLLKTETVNSVSVGAFRNLAAGDPSTDPWAIDVTQADDHCVQEGRSATFWRADAGKVDQLILEASNGSEKANISWPASYEEVEWPLEVALNDGAAYKMGMADGQVRDLKVHMVPDNLPTRAHQAAWMAERNCAQQALLLVLTAEIDALVNDLAKGGQF